MSTMTRNQGLPGLQAELRAARETTAARRSSAADPGAANEVSRELIQARAYEIFTTRQSTGGSGDAMSDWLQAERELGRGEPDPVVASRLEVVAQLRGERLLASGT